MNGQKIVKCEECMPACKINTTNGSVYIYAKDWFDILNGKKWQIVCLGGFFALNDSIFMYKLGLYLTCYPSANTYYHSIYLHEYLAGLVQCSSSSKKSI